MVKNPPSNAGDVSLIPGRGTKIPHVMEQLRFQLRSVHHNQRSHVAQLRPDAAK